MHHLRETVIDGVKFVLIPEELHDKLAEFVFNSDYAVVVADAWREHDPEVFDGF